MIKFTPIICLHIAKRQPTILSDEIEVYIPKILLSKCQVGFEIAIFFKTFLKI